MIRRRLTDDEAALLLAGQAPREEDADLATLVRATGELYLRDPRAAVGERHEAMIAAAARSLPAAEVEPVKRSRRRPRHVAALAAPAFALALALAYVTFGGAERTPAPTTVADPRSSDRTPERADVPERRSAEPAPQRRSRPRAERKAPSTPGVAPVTPPVEPAAPDPPAAGEPAPHAAVPADPKEPATLGHGGPDPEPVPLVGPLDTEPPIDEPPEGPLDTEPPIDSSPDGPAPPPTVPDPTPEP